MSISFDQPDPAQVTNYPGHMLFNSCLNFLLHMGLEEQRQAGEQDLHVIVQLEVVNSFPVPPFPS